MAPQKTDEAQKPYRPYGADIKETRPYSPCRAACPAHTDVQAYVGLIAQGRYTEAFEVITAPNPVASVCSMICHHPCEQSCRRCGVDEPLSVRHLKRFAIEKSTDYRRARRRLMPKTKNKSIGIVGSGPAGLTAANDLAKYRLQRHDLRTPSRSGRYAGLGNPSLPASAGSAEGRHRRRGFEGHRGEDEL